jgi:hypothetical protein
MASRYSTFVAKIGRLVGCLVSKHQRFHRNEAKRRHKESVATLHRFKTQEVDRARAAAALVGAANTRADAGALVMRLEQDKGGRTTVAGNQ